jgi:hypothetical protein
MCEIQRAKAETREGVARLLTAEAAKHEDAAAEIDKLAGDDANVHEPEARMHLLQADTLHGLAKVIKWSAL